MAGQILRLKLEKVIEYGFYVWLFLLPFQTRYFYAANLSGGIWEAGSLSIYASEVLLIALLVLNFIYWLKQPGKFVFSKKFKQSLPFALSVFVLYAFLTSIWSVFPALSVYYSLKLFLALGIFWLVSSISFSWWRAGLILIVTGLIQGLLAIDQFLLQIVVANKWLGMASQDAQNLGVSVVDTEFRRWLRAYGSFSHPNILGSFLSVVLVVLIEHYFKVHEKIKKIYSKREDIFKALLILTIVLTTSGLILSFSRAAWLATILIWLAVLTVVVIKKNRSWRLAWLKLFLVFVLTVGTWVVIYPELFITRIQGEQVLEIKATQDRISSLVDSKEIIKDNWLSGVGLGSHTYALHEMYPTRTVWQLQQPHNTYLLILSELGLIGLLILVWVFYVFVKDLGNRVSTKSVLSFLILGVILFLMFFDHWWWSLNFGFYFTFLLLGFIYKKLSTSQK